MTRSTARRRPCPFRELGDQMRFHVGGGRIGAGEELSLLREPDTGPRTPSTSAPTAGPHRASKMLRHPGSVSAERPASSRTRDATIVEPAARAGSRPAATPKLRMPIQRSRAAASARRREPRPARGACDAATLRDVGFECEAAGHDDEAGRPRSHARLRLPAVRTVEAAVAGQRPERKVLRIAVIAQIEDPRETGAAVVRLAPQPVLSLLADQVGDALPSPRHDRRRRRP